MSAEDLITESLRMLAQLTANHQYLDQDIVETCMDVIERLTTMEDNLFDLKLEAAATSQSAFHSNFFQTLENLNKYSRLDSLEEPLEWIRGQLEKMMDKICSFVYLPETYEYNSDVSELGFSLFKFD